MRPRSKTAENTKRRVAPSGVAISFNEAAVEDRGKRAEGLVVCRRHGRASRRPRSKTAENQAQNDRLSVSAADGFNEAAVEDRGKRSGSTATRWSRSLQ